MPCSLCKKTGHNKRTCKQPINDVLPIELPTVLCDLIVDYKTQMEQLEKQELKREQDLNYIVQQNQACYEFIMRYNNRL